MNEPDSDWLHARCIYWQEILRLEDWRISAVFVRPWEMSDKDKKPNGEVDRDPIRKHARIKLLDLTDIPPTEHFPAELDPLDDDPEVLLVHELLHVSLDLCDRLVDDEAGTYELGQEQHIIAVSKALVQLDRAHQPRSIVLAGRLPSFIPPESPTEGSETHG